MSKRDEEEVEEHSLIPQPEVIQERSYTVIFPALYVLFASLSVLVPLVYSCSTLLLPCAPSLSQLPLKLPTFSQFASLLSSLTGAATILSFHSLVFRSRSQAPILKPTFWAGLAAGLASQAAFLGHGFGWTVSTQKSASLLYVFEVLSLLHACATLTLLYDLREAQVLSPASSLLFYKSSALLVLLLSTALVVLSAASSLLSRPLAYAVVIAHVAYLGAFYFDLRSLSLRLRCSFGQREIAMLHKVTL